MDSFTATVLTIWDTKKNPFRKIKNNNDPHHPETPSGNNGGIIMLWGFISELTGR